jgi:hypothetical protein
MKKVGMKSLIDVHICNFARENGEDCASKNAKSLTDELKKWGKEEMKGEIKIFRGGCQGNCTKGISIGIYPEREFLIEVNSNDSEEIKKGLKEALEKIKN